jgi:23S rRNA (cytosine1962-C5)-methyltransferase
MARVRLKPGRDKSLKRRHPWVFSGAIGSVEGETSPGDTVEVMSAEGASFGHGAWSPASQIAVRMWSFAPDERVDADFLAARVARAVARRTTEASFLVNTAEEGAVEAATPAPGNATDAQRLINAESDGLPGLIVDRYADFLVCQLRSAGAERWREEIVAALAAAVPHRGIWERSDTGARAKEGLEPRTGLLAGEEPPELVEIAEDPCRFLVDVRNGHKTGFYLDQRDNRALVAAHARGREVLNAFAYTGAFGIQALTAGAAKVTNVESAPGLLALAARHVAHNGLDETAVENIEGDVAQVLRRFRDSRREFDLIVLDPPKFAESSSQVPAASRGYKDINLLAFKLLRPGGLLFTFSCSAHVRPELFQKIVADAALDAGREARILQRLAQPADHPVALSFPEAGYLKGLVCGVD